MLKIKFDCLRLGQTARFVLLISIINSLMSCRQCKKCSVEVAGTIIGDSQELCGEELKQAETANLNCK